mgnify:CR=1 FL=1
MKSLDPKNLSVPEVHQYLLSAVVPRPIAFASTVDAKGRVNLSPYSFFNCFGANPPILVFSPSRRGRDNTTKHTFQNVKEVSEVVISMVTYNMVEQMSLASTEYPKGVNEFEKAGFTAVASERVTPPRIGESPVNFECQVKEVKPLGEEGGAGNLVICEVVLMHFNESVLGENGKVDPFKLDAVARLGGNFYSRIIPETLFEVGKPLKRLGIGIDQLPENIRNSTVLTGNDLAKLANVEAVPVPDDELKKKANVLVTGKTVEQIHRIVSEILLRGEIELAWACLLEG